MHRSTSIALLATLATASVAHAQVGAPAISPRSPTPVVTTGLFAFRSDMLFNLHDFLVWNAHAGAPVDPRPECLSRLDEARRAAFDAARDHYAATFGGLGPFDRLAVGLWFELAGFPDVEIVPDSVLAPTLALLHAASPAYEACWWRDHDARNRAWIAGVVELLDAHEDALRVRHALVLGADWRAPLPVDVVGWVSRAGAGTVVRPHHILISAADPRHNGEAALEVAFHEASHTLLGPGIGVVWEALVAAAEGEQAVRLAREIWHPLLFYTSGELVRARLADHGKTEYEPYAYRHGLFERVWPRFREPLEGHWQPYLEGAIGLEEAVARLAGALGATSSSAAAAQRTACGPGC